ncbi:MAG: biotin/lipoyl-binding protein [Saprospiraceae bacterium]|nr:biotin/lipoyl-binding protein [Bacteroidia bacterium]NNE15499.1 biotin/lipoyl-binding protein [Saprospiraceae bacterium]NNL93142.1 biotin/lipoyl-binding protein [Saprospiraceae bacterium]
MNYRIKNGDDSIEVSLESAKSLDISKSKDGQIHILSNDQSYHAEILSVNTFDKSITLMLNNRKYDFLIEDSLDQLIDKMGLSKVDNLISKEVKAPMPGLILDIMVEKGQTVKQGDSLLILEAMKMENVIKAEADVTIQDIKLKKGDTVEKNEVIIVLE